jgi:hypothetical protein
MVGSQVWFMCEKLQVHFPEIGELTPTTTNQPFFSTNTNTFFSSRTYICLHTHTKKKSKNIYWKYKQQKNEENELICMFVFLDTMRGKAQNKNYFLIKWGVETLKISTNNNCLTWVNKAHLLQFILTKTFAHLFVLW